MVPHGGDIALPKRAAVALATTRPYNSVSLLAFRHSALDIHSSFDLRHFLPGFVLLAGPIFSREVLTSPRQPRHFIMRCGYVLGLFVLMYTASQATFGWQQVTSLGETARFGSLLFQLFSLVQLALVLFFAPLFAASRI